MLVKDLQRRHHITFPTSTRSPNSPTHPRSPNLLHPRCSFHRQPPPHSPRYPPASQTPHSPYAASPHILLRGPDPLYQGKSATPRRSPYRTRGAHRLRQYYYPIQPAWRPSGASSGRRCAMVLCAPFTWPRYRKPGGRDGQVHEWLVAVEYSSRGIPAGCAG